LWKELTKQDITKFWAFGPDDAPTLVTMASELEDQERIREKSVDGTRSSSCPNLQFADYCHRSNAVTSNLPANDFPSLRDYTILRQ